MVGSSHGTEHSAYRQKAYEAVGVHGLGDRFRVAPADRVVHLLLLEPLFDPRGAPTSPGLRHSSTSRRPTPLRTDSPYMLDMCSMRRQVNRL